MSDHHIAIVGVAGQFPSAPNITELWTMLRDGREAVREFTDDELKAAGVDAATMNNPNFVRAGAPLDDPGGFDAAFFGYTPREAELMDPQHRIFLESAWHALEDAGYAPDKYDGLIGVFGGVARNTYLLNNASTYVRLNESGGSYEVALSSDKDYVATRVAYKLNLRGPSFSVQAACSSSGIAVHLAIQSLLNGDCDIALAGGARVHVPQTAGYIWVEGAIPSRDGHCRAFDAEATGCVYGSGAAIVALKRLEDAIADRDSIYAVIRGTAINNDGSAKIGFTAPSMTGQREVIEAALDVAEVDPETIGYVECHGTGTRIGDPIEIAALTQAYRRYTGSCGYCAVGSLKASIGHLDAGAGVAGLIKVALMLRHGKLVPSVNYESPNPEIDFASSPFYVIDEYRDWTVDGSPRRAAISSFGLGGTNFHAILEEAPPQERDEQPEWPVVLPISAATPDSLAATRERLADFARNTDSDDLPDVAYTLQVGRTELGHRRAIVARSGMEWAAALERPLPPTAANSDLDRVCFMFSGQGAQYPHMGRTAYSTSSVFRDAFDQCCSIVTPLIGQDLKEVVFSDEDFDRSSENLAQTRIAQPALFAVEYALAQHWIHWGIEPDLLIGHSLGEYVAACIAGIFGLEDALATVARRGELMQSMPRGSMLAIAADEDAVRSMLDDELELAAVNAPSLCVVGGPSDRVQALAEQLEDRGVRATVLRTSHAFHTRMMEGMLQEFRAHLESISFGEPQIPIVSNLTGDWLQNEDARDPDYWVRHVRQPVRFADGISAVTRDGQALLLEVGPGEVLSGLARTCLPSGHPIVSSLPRHDDDTDDLVFLLQRFGDIWAHGYPVDWHKILPARRRVQVPGYSFEHAHHWLSPAPETTSLAKTTYDQLAVTPSHEGGTAPAQLAPAALAERIDRVKQKLKDILHELSGIDESALDDDLSFVELGFDSLFLTRAASICQQEFGVEVGFRMLLEETPSISSLGEWLDECLPPDAFPAPAAPIATQAEATQLPEDGSVTSQLRELMQQQAALLNSQLALLGGTQIPAPVPVTQVPASSPEPTSTTAETTSGAAKGPWKPITVAAGQDLSESQKAFLAGLRSSLEAKYGGSKSWTQQNRSHLADPRAVAGYRQAWKELIYPIVADRSSGSRIRDIDGNELVDFAMGFGVHLFGHRPEFLSKAVAEQLERGFEIGPTPPLAGETAALLCEMTGHDRAAFCNTGSEAVLAAIRIARTVTGREKIVFFSNDYHGIFDETLASSYAGGPPRPIAPGIPASAVQNVIVLEYGEQSALERIQAQQNEIAAVIVEPVQSRHPELQPAQFLKSLRELTRAADIPLVFDEIITGFRSHPRGAQGIFDIKADIATYGKAIGGGFPIAVVAGSARYLDALDGGHWNYGDDSYPPVGVTWFAGTFVRHPVALAATRACLVHMRDKGATLQETLNANTRELVARLNEHCIRRGAPIHIETFSSLFNIKLQTNQEVAPLLFLCLRDHGIHITEGRAAFVSTAHTEADLRLFEKAFCDSVDALLDSGWLPSSRAPEISREAYGKLVETLDHDRILKQQECDAASFTENADLLRRADELCAALIVELFRSVGIEFSQQTSLSFDEIGKRFEIIPECEKALVYMIGVLEEEGLAVVDKTTISFSDMPERLADPAGLARRLIEDFPDYAGLFELLGLCFEHYPDVLAGREHGANVLIPGGDRTFVKGYLQERTAPYRNLVVYERLAADLLGELKSHGAVKVLEIGAGGGDETRRLIPLLDDSDRYVFTDIGSTFIFDARKSFREYIDRGILAATVYDVSKPAPEDVVNAGPYDLIIGLNVVHATSDVGDTLRNLRPLLKDSGILALVELTKSPRWENLIWGLTAGWWYFDDDYRTTQPLLSFSTWDKAMLDAGMSDVVVLPRSNEDRARSDAALVLGRAEPAESAAQVGPIPLTDAQEEILLAALVDEDANRAFNITSSLEFRGTLDVVALELAARSLVAQNAILRSRVSSDQGQLIPVDDPEVIFELTAACRSDLEELQHHENAEPFEIEQEPLIRFRLVALEDECYILLTTVHHIVADGWSVGNIHLALGELYEKQISGSSTSNSERSQFVDYARAQAGNTKRFERALSYWREELDDYESEFELPTDRPRPTKRTYAARAEEICLDGDFCESLRAAGAKQGCTMFTTLLSAYCLFLNRLARREDLVIGITAAGQFFSQMPDVIGHCINTLPLRLRLSSATSINDVLRGVRSKVSDAFDHYECTYGRLLRELSVTRDPSRPTLISTVFNFDPIGERPRFGGLDVLPRFVPKAYEVYESFLNVAEQENGLSVQLVANSRLFDASTLKRHLELYRQCLEHVIERGNEQISTVPFMDYESEKRIRALNSRTCEIDDQATLHGMFEQVASRFPDAVAVKDESGSLTYEQLDQSASALAARLVEQGVAAGTTVGLVFERSAEMIVAILATLKSGAAYVPLDPDYPEERLNYVVSDADPRVVLSHAPCADLARGLGRELILVDDSQLCGEPGVSVPLPQVAPTDAAYVIYTSGSTGTPKGVVNEHRNICAYLQSYADEAAITLDDAAILRTQYSFDVSISEIFLMLTAGGRLILSRPAGERDPDYLSRLVHQNAVTVLHFVPSLLEVFLEGTDLAERCRTLRFVIASGEPLTRELRNRFRELLPDCELRNLYGPTETAVHVTHALSSAENPADIVSIGVPIDNTQIWILDENRAVVPLGVSGELYIGGPQVARGYLNKPELTSERFVTDPFDRGSHMYRSGDLARYTSDGTIECLGRLDDQVKIRGFRIELGEVRAALEQLPEVTKAAVLKSSDPARGDYLAGYFEPDDGGVNPSDLIGSVRRILPHYMVPAVLVPVARIPLLSNGKVDRRALLAAEPPIPGSAETGVAPATETEIAIAEIWSELLGCNVSRDSDFFACGGHSLLAVRAVRKCQEILAKDVPLSAIFDVSTLAEFAADVDRCPDMEKSKRDVVII